MTLKVWQVIVPSYCTSYVIRAWDDRTLTWPSNRTNLAATLEGLPSGCTASITVDYPVRWSQIAGPAGAVADIADKTRQITDVTLPTPGTYVFEVSMDDGKYGRDQVAVTLLPAPGGGGSTISGTVSFAIPGKRGLAAGVRVEAIPEGEGCVHHDDRHQGTL